MKIGIISDTHGDLAGWTEAMEKVFAGVDLIIHIGDILYHGPRNPLPAGYDPAALAEAINASPVPVIFARGNCDADIDQLVIKYPLQAPYAFVVIEGLRIMAGHGDDLDDQETAALGRNYRLDVLACGHTHRPLLRRVGSTVVINPGSPSLSKHEVNGKIVRTVGLIDDRSARIIDLDTSQAITEIALRE
jgi:putative phosphoesterase